MQVEEKTDGRKAPYTIMMDTWLMLNNQMMVNLELYERDYDQTIDFYMNNDNQLTNTPSRRYAAQIVIPKREYVEVEGENKETDEVDEGGEMGDGVQYEPIPFSIDKVTLILWGLD